MFILSRRLIYCFDWLVLVFVLFIGNRRTGLQVVFDVATERQGMVEEYNNLLHTLRFQPQSIMNRMDAVRQIVSFIRFELYLCVSLQLIVIVADLFSPSVVLLPAPVPVLVLFHFVLQG